jgi:hypothetical protein
MYKKQSNQCNSNTQWVQNGNNCPTTCTTTSWTATSEYACNNSVSQRKYTSDQCQGVFEWRNEGTACAVTYTSNIPTPATFTRNNCASGCTAGSIQYSILATSFISQVDANNKFNTEGQAAANQNGTCTNCPCVTTSWTATTEYACNGGVSQRKYTSNQCSGVFEWRNEGDACNNSRTILLSSPTTSSSEDACLISSGSTKYISNTVAISNGLEIFNNSTLTTRTYNTNPGNWSTIIDGSSKYAVQFDSSGVVSVIISCNTVPTPVTPTPITPTPVPVTPIPPSVTYYELEGCTDSQYKFTTIVPDGINQRYIIPTEPTVFYRYTGSSVTQSTVPLTFNGSLQKTTQYNCS